MTASSTRRPSAATRALVGMAVLLACSATALVLHPTASAASGRGAGQQTTGVASQTGVFDANAVYTSGVVLPVRRATPAALQPLTRPSWVAGARIVNRVAADGATLLLLRVRVPSNQTSPVRFSLERPVGEIAPTGFLWPVDAQALVDRTPAGGNIDDQPVGQIALTVPTVAIDGARWAFALYQSPRNFDPASSPGMTAGQHDRTVTLVTRLPGDLGVMRSALDVTRPFLLFIHGTSDDVSGWDSFPLWANSANELKNFQYQPGGLPFQADRLSYHWIWGALGGAVENGRTILEQLNGHIQYWRTSTQSAGTQADVVTHSFGGFVAREAAQTQADPNPMTFDESHNFRSASNWGHGLYHKLITLAATHRGSAAANAVAYLNQNG